MRHLAAALLAVVLAACGASGGERSAIAPPASASSTTVAPEPPAAAVTTPPAAAMTTAPTACQPAPLEDRAAAVLVLGIGEATAADAPLASDVVALGVGGVLLLGLNVIDQDQVRALVEGLRERAPRRLLVTVDEEGGRVSRLRPILGRTPSARTLGERPLPEIADVGAERGALLRDLGFDLVLAPVADAEGGPVGGPIGDRAFAATPGEAGARAAAFAEGLRRAGMAATAKHFPGQGGLDDSHDGTVVSDAPRDQVERIAAAGFGPLVDAGVPAVMMSHVTFRSLGGQPASLEPAAYRLLRSMGFGGVAVTDAVGMSAITDRWSLPNAAVLAIAAGADLVLATPGESAAAMRDAIVAAVADGSLPERRLDEAVGRVLTLQGEDPSTMLCR